MRLALGCRRGYLGFRCLLLTSSVVNIITVQYQLGHWR